MKNLRSQLIFVIPFVVLIGALYLLTLRTNINDFIMKEYEYSWKVYDAKEMLYDQKDEIDAIIAKFNTNPKEVNVVKLKERINRYQQDYNASFEELASLKFKDHSKYESIDKMLADYERAYGTVILIFVLLIVEISLIVATLRENSKALL